jgi:hypothetical protein
MSKFSRYEETMKRTLVVIIGAIALLCALGIPVFHSAAAKPAPAPPAEHPEYRDAMEALRNARKHLEKAEADGYGHRDRAMRAVDNALDECNQAVQILH